MGLLEAARADSLEDIKKVLSNDSAAVKKEGLAALLQAAQNGNFSIVKHMTEYAGVNLGDADHKGNGVLHHGVLSGNVELVQYLTERCGCNPMEGNLEGVTPFDLAHRFPSREVEQYFERYCGVLYEDTYHNPIHRGFFPDPSVIRVGEDYYMVNSSFCYVPCIPISHSRDLIHWNIIGHAITDAGDAGLHELDGGRGYWAPDISYAEGRFYVTATYRLNEVKGIRRKQMITSAENPGGPYEKPVWMEVDGIDPSLFHDDDGRHYMVLNRGAKILELSADCKETISEAHLLWYGDNKVNPEGPHILKKDGWYYLFLAEGGTGKNHQVTVARSRQLKGVYEPCPYNPILTQKNTSALLQCCGHGMPVDTPDGRWYLAYLCLRVPECGYGILGRETCLDPITWTSDGWPLVNGGKGPGCQQTLPFLPAKAEAETTHDSDLEWMVHRHGKRAIIRDENGNLVIRGNGRDLCDLACDSMLLRRQRDFCFQAECRIVLYTAAIGENVGLTCYYDENSYMKFGLGKGDNGWEIGIWEYVGDHYRTVQMLPYESHQVSLRIVTSYLERRCYYSLSGTDWILAGILPDTSYLSSEGLRMGKRFTGATVGLYVHGDTTGRFSFVYSA